ncbi:MAG: aldo/keto reductase [Clostridia bacterium]|nr:aldo/keto reductase [Clostridia bacterium]
MNTVLLGSTGIKVKQNAFGALPVQRDDMETSVKILRRAYEGGMRFFDTARAYSDSEEKIGAALADVRSDIFIASKSMAKKPDDFKLQLDTSLNKLRTDYIDIYQFHCADRVYRPNDGTGMYECMLEAKAAGKINHIGITAHKIEIVFEAVKSGLYETLQFPFSYLSGPREIELVKLCREQNVGFIAMKGLAGGLITNSKAAMAFMNDFDNVLPIWGIQRMSELEEWLAYFNDTPVMDDETATYIAEERKTLSGDFCRGCGYCMPCPQGILINQCARMSLMLRRAPSANWLTPAMQEEMRKTEKCIDCRQCVSRCPYSLDTPSLLRKNYEDYKKILAGEIRVD